MYLAWSSGHSKSAWWSSRIPSPHFDSFVRVLKQSVAIQVPPSSTFSSVGGFRPKPRPPISAGVSSASAKIRKWFYLKETLKIWKLSGLPEQQMNWACCSGQPYSIFPFSCIPGHFSSLVRVLMQSVCKQEESFSISEGSLSEPGKLLEILKSAKSEAFPQNIV